MPTVRNNETEDQFIGRCMSEIKDEFPDSKQRYAVCMSYYKRNEEKMKKEELFVLIPRKKENRGQYLTRCSRNNKIKVQFKDVKERLNFCLTSFGEYYKYWAKIEMSEIPEDSALGACITKKKIQGLDYKEAYRRCASKVVVTPGPVVLKDMLNIFGVIPKYFDMCPVATELFKHLITMDMDEETIGMVRSAAIVADRVFEIEKMVIDNEQVLPEQLVEAVALVQDFKDIIHEIDEEVGMTHNTDFMDGHIEKIKSYMDDDLMIEPVEFATVGPRGGIKESKKAPKSDTPNPEPKGEGSAKGDASSTRGAKVTAQQEKTLEQKAKDFNEKESNTKNGNATLGSLKSVFQRGLGAYNTSHSPNVKSAEQWAYARVNAFLYLLKNGRPQNPKYTTDYDLLPKGHPKKG